MRNVVADANVFVSFFVERNKVQQAAALRLLAAAEEGEIGGVIPQSVVFEIVYVLQSQYKLTPGQLATVVNAVTAFPGMRVVAGVSRAGYRGRSVPRIDRRAAQRY